VPFAFGLLRPEICLPISAQKHLKTAELRSLLAHELAHLVRRDPLWRFLTVWLEDVLFFQPLNRVTGRRLNRLAEFMSDDWSCRYTSPRSMAQCLASVAAWLPRKGPQPVVASPMQGSGSELVERVRRLTSPDTSGEIRRPFLALGACLLIASVPVLAAVPGFRVVPEIRMHEAALLPTTAPSTLAPSAAPPTSLRSAVLHPIAVEPAVDLDVRVEVPELAVVASEGLVVELDPTPTVEPLLGLIVVVEAPLQVELPNPLVAEPTVSVGGL